MFHIIWTTRGINGEAFCQSFVTTIRYGLQSCSAETQLSSQASEWERKFKWSRRQGRKPTKSLTKSQWGPLSYILIQTLWLKKFTFFIFSISTLEFILTELMKLLSRVTSTALILNYYLRRRKRNGRIRKKYNKIHFKSHHTSLLMMVLY